MCGILGVVATTPVNQLLYDGLLLLQHRGQEAAGITSWDGRDFQTKRAMGHVAGNFDNDEAIRSLPGGLWIPEAKMISKSTWSLAVCTYWARFSRGNNVEIAW